ncbi:caspase family protein [Moorena producens JHB]|uniref:Caspase family protein n=1 Tax=Moorena producens (strain JHB) TaxID=1454205 RepID=A0A1D9FZ96_MOOP1|nr:caspase family protein [Moorena producens]AOY80594.1 caspase family protein [Moorena producens JHB]
MFSRNLAFIIGINNYTNGISPLNTAVKDAKKLAEILRTKHDYEVWLWLDQVATLSNFHKFLFHTLPEQVTENDRLFFYFAGHGVALNGDDGPAGYLIPQDAKLGDTNSYLPMTKLHDAFISLPCRHFLGILDCCFAGAFRWSNTRDLLTSPEVIHQERYDRFISDPAWQIITSSASDQKALDNFNLDSVRGQVGNHSPFSSALLEALEGAADIYPPATNGKPAGDGVITATELYLHLRDRVEIATEKCRLRQTPGIWCLNKHDKGEYIFLSPGHELNLPPAPPLDESQNPYRGLNSFDEKHSSLFFGRTLLVEKLHNFVKANPLTVVLGASGSGKSSLVKGGLIPNLRQYKTWCILPPIRPGETPLQPLNDVLCNAKLPGVEPQNPEHNLAMSIDVWAKNNPNSKLLLFIDQSEEIITLCRNLDERKEFLQQILTAINAHGDKLRVVLSLRSDFEPQVRDAGLRFVPTDYNVGNTVLKNCWHNGRFIVPGMTRGELKEAIEKPAQARVMYFQPHELVEQLIDEVADMPGALPLLSFALSELYLKYLRRQRQAQYRGITIDRALTQADYIELGGVMRSLTQRADEEYQALVNENPAYDQVIRHVMLRMVALTGGELARRRVPLSELEYPPQKNDLVKEVIDRFTNARLLVTGEDAEGNPYVEPAHDALVRGWQRLLEWKQKDEENLLLQRRLTPAAVEWKSQQKARFLWHTNPRLDLLKKVSLSDDNWLNQVEAEFVRRSVKRKSFNTRRNWGVAIAVFLGLGTGLVFSLIGQRDALIGQISANRQAAEANLLNQELDALLNSLRASKSLKDWPRYLSLFKPDSKLEARVRATLQKAVYGIRERDRLEQDKGQMISGLSTNGRKLANLEQYGFVCSWDNLVCLWDKSGELMAKFLEPQHSLKSITFSPDRSKLIIASNKVSPDGSVSHDSPLTLRLWDLKSKKQLAEFKGRSGDVWSVSFSPDGSKIAIAGDEGIRLWDANGKQIPEFKGGQDRVTHVVFSPDGTKLAAVNSTRYWSFDSNQYEGSIKVSLWDLKGQQIGQLKGNVLVEKVIFSPDGTWLATTGPYGSTEYGTVRFWDLLGNQVGQLKGAFGDVIFSPDGRLLAGSGENIPRVWDLWGNQLGEFKGHQGGGSGVIFSSDGKQLVTAGIDGTVRLWDLNGKEFSQFNGQQEISFDGFSFSPDGSKFATAEKDGNARLWDLSGKKLAEFNGPNLERRSSRVIFSPDGQQLAVTGEDSIIRLWDVKNRTLLKTESKKSQLRDGSFLLTNKDKDDTILWNWEGKQLAKFEDLKGDIKSVSLSPNGNKLATLEQGLVENSTVYLWNWEGKQLAKFKGSGYSMTFSPDGNLLATSGSGTAQLWDLSGKKVAEFTTAYPYGVVSISFSPNGKLIATAGLDGIVKLWDLESKLQVAEFNAEHRGQVKDLTFSPNGKLLAMVRNDGIAKFWRVESFDELMVRGCNWVRNYLENNPNIEKSDRHLCDNVNK